MFKKNTIIKRPQFSASKQNAATIRHYRFAQKYVELNHNGTQAYLAVYGDEHVVNKGNNMSNDVANAAAARLLANVSVSNYIAEITNELIYETKINSTKILARYNRWADSDIGEILDWGNVEIFDTDGSAYSPPRFKIIVKIKDYDDISADALSCIDSIQANRAGVSISLVSKLEANNRLAEFLGLCVGNRNRQREIILHFDLNKDT